MYRRDAKTQSKQEKSPQMNTDEIDFVSVLNICVHLCLSVDKFLCDSASLWFKFK